MAEKEVKARVKINTLFEDAGWQFLTQIVVKIPVENTTIGTSVQYELASTHSTALDLSF